jgi:hypothetical protein
MKEQNPVELIEAIIEQAEKDKRWNVEQSFEIEVPVETINQLFRGFREMHERDFFIHSHDIYADEHFNMSMSTRSDLSTEGKFPLHAWYDCELLIGEPDYTPPDHFKDDTDNMCPVEIFYGKPISRNQTDKVYFYNGVHLFETRAPKAFDEGDMIIVEITRCPEIGLIARHVVSRYHKEKGKVLTRADFE